MGTIIGWTNETWNPITGCSKVSPGCAHCYAEALSLRYGWSKKPWTPENAAENVICHEDRLNKPRTWKTPRMVFVNSMSDLFHENVPVEFIGRILNVIGSCPQHTFQVLTKRPERMLEVMGAYYGTTRQEPFPNLWLGASVENQHWANVRIPILTQVPTEVRFLSCEPLLGPVDFGQAHFQWDFWLSWIIVGGESGAGFRRMDLDWARGIRDQCVASGVPFFFKQQSAYRSEQMPYLDGAEWRQYPGVAV